MWSFLFKVVHLTRNECSKFWEKMKIRSTTLFLYQFFVFFYSQVTHSHQHEPHNVTSTLNVAKKKKTNWDKIHWVFLCYLFIVFLMLLDIFPLINLLYFYYRKKEYLINSKYMNPTARTGTDIWGEWGSNLRCARLHHSVHKLFYTQKRYQYPEIHYMGAGSFKLFLKAIMLLRTKGECFLLYFG